MEEPFGADAQLQVDNQMMVYSMIDGPLMLQSPLTKQSLQIKENLPTILLFQRRNRGGSDLNEAAPGPASSR